MFIKESDTLNGVSRLEATPDGNKMGFTLKNFRAHRLGVDFVEDTLTFSKARVLRSLSVKPDQLISCLAGKIRVAVIDLTPGSPSYGEHELYDLVKNSQSLFVPAGYATGYIVTHSSATVYQKFGEYDYYREELALKWDDPDFEINWGIDNPIVTKRDAEGVTMRQFYNLSIGAPEETEWDHEIEQTIENDPELEKEKDEPEGPEVID